MDYFTAADLEPEFFCRVTADTLCKGGRRIVAATAIGDLTCNSIASETVRQISPHKLVGLVEMALEFDDGTATNVVIKAKPTDAEVDQTIDLVMALTSPHVKSVWADNAAGNYLGGLCRRELALYRTSEPTLTAVLPKCYGTYEVAEREASVVVIERLHDDVRLLDKVDQPHVWTVADIEAAVLGIAGVHGHWLGRHDELAAMRWMLPLSEPPRMAPIWAALWEHTAERFPELIPQAWRGRGTRLLTNPDRWWNEVLTMPRTLVHNDFSPRNIALRTDGTLVAYDWELVTAHVPQRDLVELLAFTQPPDVEREAVDHYLEFHRRAVAAASGVDIDAATWRRGYQLALIDLATTRMMIYAALHQFKPFPYLPRVAATLARFAEFEQ